jgi:hypothetical protein
MACTAFQRIHCRIFGLSAPPVQLQNRQGGYLTVDREFSSKSIHCCCTLLEALRPPFVSEQVMLHCAQDIMPGEAQLCFKGIIRAG